MYICTGLGYRVCKPIIPYFVAFLLALFLQCMAALLRPFTAMRPRLSVSAVHQLYRHQWYSTAAARDVLDYSPPWSRAEALEITLQLGDAALRNPRAQVKAVGPFSSAEVARHCTEDDAWIIVDSKVYAVTPYLGQHPGGDAMLRNAGRDSSAGFHGPQHPPSAAEVLDEFYIGDLRQD
jgi:cytochrome b involved in lipid metabolism